MYLKELRINGFKSFADPTSLIFSPGITTIVGPNGCGKSNTADAIRWVLGEQSAKSLRAGSMQDVIFQGTDGRKPVNLCEVTLLFTDCEKQLGTAYNEIEISRRVFRDGGSSYFINGKASRLKDIQRLFMDTGIGQVSYSFMVQGQIDQILSSNPAERRTIFEEAAGVTRYKAQRREAMNKLALVDTNLTRVTDVIEEVSRQIGVLKRQASKALRYKRIQHRLTHLDLAHCGFRYSTLKESIRKIEEDSIGLRKDVGNLEAELSGVDTKLEDKRNLRNELYESLQEMQKQVYDLRSRKEHEDSQREFATIRIQDINKRIEDINKELIELEDEVTVLKDRAAGGTEDKQAFIDLLGNSNDVFEEKNQDLAASQEKLQEAESELQSLKQKLIVSESGISRLRSNCTSLEVSVKEYQVKHAAQTEEIFTLKNDQVVLEEDLKNISGTLSSRLEQKDVEDAELNKLRDEERQCQEDFREIQMDIQRTDRNAAQIIAQIGVIERLQEKLEGFSEGAKAILQGKMESVMPADAYRLLTKEIQVDSDYTKPFEALMGPAIDAIVLQDPANVLPVTEFLESRKLGRACLQIGVGQKGEEKNPNCPEFLVPASRFVFTQNESLSGLLSNLLRGCYFCESLEQFFEYWKENQDFEFSFVSTHRGELIDRRGLIYGGSGRGKNDSFLQRQNEIKKLNKAKAKEEKALDALREKAASLQERLETLERNVEDKRSLIVEIGHEVSTLKTQEQLCRENIERNQKRFESAEQALAALEQDNKESISRLEEASKALGEAEGQIESIRESIGTWEENVVQLRLERDNKRENLSEVRLQLAEKKQRLELIDRNLGEIERKLEEIEQLKTKRKSEISGLSDQLVELEGSIDSAQSNAEKIEEELNTVRTELDKKRSDLNEAESSIKTLEESISSEQEDLINKQSDLNKFEVQLAKENSQLNFLIEEVDREYDAVVQDIDWRREMWFAGDPLPERIRVDLDDEESAEGAQEVQERGEPTEENLAEQDGVDWDEIAEEVKNLRTRLHSMGPVNLVAIEEYAELKERHIFLKTQSDDLWKSKDELLKAIDDINQTSVTLFRETFEKVRKNFAFTFDSLFAGGQSDLKLVDNEDVLESGIDIIARPPGTKLRSLQLLSGGQKTMTAVALLFAIYMVKPSPFCMLDELDAPLDDANVGRFTDIVTKFTERSQFIIITHNKRTISAANTIYGVTMQEKGVSKIVSMRFDKEKGKAESLETGEEISVEEFVGAGA